MAQVGPAPPPKKGEFVSPWLHPYAHVLKHRGPQFWDYENFRPAWGTVDPYECHRKIGRGKYSEVFVGKNRINHETCVIKVLKPVKQKKIYREISILQHLFGGPNVIHMLDVCIEPTTETPVLIFEYVNNTDFRTLYPRFTDMDVRYYMFEILRTLEFSHSMGIMHRDIKPHNICIDHKQRKLRVIDWGLGEFYHYNQEYNCRVASRFYKGPELMVGYRKYDYTLDMWSLGCMLGGILFQKEPLFHGRDNNDQLIQILKVMGTKDLVDYLEKYRITLPTVFEGEIRNWEKRPWSSFIPKSSPLCNDLAMDLLDKLLQFDHGKRILAKDAMMHPYFDPVRY